MRIPKNIVKESQYTSGGDFIDSKKQLYSGYYFEINGSYFKGKEYTGDNEELIKINKNKGITQFLGNSLLDKIIKFASENINSKIFEFNGVDFQKGYSIRYFSKQVNNNNSVLIKEIDEQTYKKLQGNSLYQTLSLKYYVMTKTADNPSNTTQQNLGYFNERDLAEAEKKMQGITLFLQS
jgi:hypothetical protein